MMENIYLASKMTTSHFKLKKNVEKNQKFSAIAAAVVVIYNFNAPTRERKIKFFASEPKTVDFGNWSMRMYVCVYVYVCMCDCKMNI